MRSLTRSFPLPAWLVVVLVVVAVALAVAVGSTTAARSVTGRGIVLSGVTSSLVPLDITVTSPADNDVNGRAGEIKVTSSTKVYSQTGQTSIGGKLQLVQTKRITARGLKDGEEITFKGSYTPGDPKSITATKITMHDRSFTICGKLQGITRRTATNAGENEFTVNITKVTVQEDRYSRFLSVGKDVVFAYSDSTKFHNANKSWKDPKNRVSIQPADIVADQQVTAVRGKIKDVNKLDATDVDMGIKCS